MKKLLKLLVFTLVITVTLSFGAGTALAADYSHCADALQAMGLFQSAENGFELDRPATRAEAAMMLVSLLGAAQEAENGSYSHPFTDVPDWASPYVGYMYENGLTKGVSASSFAPQANCDLRMYSAFVLRALGYTEAAGDFTYADAATHATDLGVVDIINGAGAFNRDNMAAISYTALFAPSKGADTMLLSQLIEQGAVTAEAARPYLELFDAYTLIQKANANLAGQVEKPLEMKLDMTMKMDMGEMGQANITLSSLLQMDASAMSGLSTVEDVMTALDKLKFALTNKMSLGGETAGGAEMELAVDLYLLDNVLYIDNNLGEVAGDDTIPANLKVDVDTLLALMNMSGMDFTAMMQDMESLTSGLMPADPYAAHYGIAMIKDIESKSLPEGGQLLNVTFIDLPNEMLNSIAGAVYGGMPEIMDIMAQTTMDCQISDCSYTLDKGGNIVAQSVAASVMQAMFAGTEDEASANTDMSMSLEITKTGTAVQISEPAKDVEYVDLLALIMGGI